MKTCTRFFLLVSIVLLSTLKPAEAQNPTHSLVGYWQNWNDGACPFFPLEEVDNRYEVICIAFALPVTGTTYDMQFTPEGMSVDAFKAQIDTLQQHGKKVVISIGGASGFVQMNDTNERDVFVTSMLQIINDYGFDGLDIDLEGGSLSLSGGTIAEPIDAPIINLIDAVKILMKSFYATYGTKMFLGMAPETAYVQGGMSAYNGLWGAYLPLIHALRDSLDILYVQLYNSGSMYGIDGNVYEQGTADFIVSQTEAVLQGFNTNGGHFDPLEPHQVAVGLPACQNAGGGFIDTATVKDAVDYLLGDGSQPGSYTLVNPDGYPHLKGMMTWSVNWDRVSTCGLAWEFAINYEKIFGLEMGTDPIAFNQVALKCYPNPANQYVEIALDGTIPSESRLVLYDLFGRRITEIPVVKHEGQGVRHSAISIPVNDLAEGLYVLQIEGVRTLTRTKVLVVH